ncbi:MAG: hypothetical protein KDA96_10310 [Planctomycetaceae bacterium]|nr:hypothetical protein [Planctomycetaceae bacterium]
MKPILLPGRLQRSQLGIGVLLVLSLLLEVHPPAAAQQGAANAATQPPLGSAMTLEQLNAAKSQSNSPAPAVDELPAPHDVMPAAEPVPALRLKFYPEVWERRPGQAALHFSRAVVAMSQIPRESLVQWQSEEWLQGRGEGTLPTDEELETAVQALAPVFTELHELAFSEDLTFDHRLRDIEGPELFEYTLGDVQEVRTFARLLQLRVRHQLKQKDFEGAIRSIRDGIRLAEFVGQGETLIQRLVGIAVASIMRECILNAISTDGCPNLYWAVASIPPSLVETADSARWELNNIVRIFPAIGRAGRETWSEETANAEWRNMMLQLKGMVGQRSAKDATLIAAAAISAAQISEARTRLLKSGMTEDQLDQMPSTQLILIDTGRELTLWGNELSKSMYLPPHLGQPLNRAAQQRFNGWIKENRHTSSAAMIAALLFPAVVQVREAELRFQMARNQLMTLEAIRMHAATRHSLPATLDQLSPVPALPDPWVNQPFEYSVEEVDGHSVVTLEAAGPLSWKKLRVLRVRFPQGLNSAP